MGGAAPVRLIAFYLPQFHPILENDEWWGTGFTEWRTVARARPLFRGHYQPHLPADLGFYDLRLPEAREAQAALAQEHGIHGFCYYHYWFQGRRLLEHPFEEVRRLRTPKLPFCLCWANEHWTRAWDGQTGQILVGQTYSHDDDVAHGEYLASVFQDERYIRVGGKPLFLVYRTSRMPDPRRTAETWRAIARRAGIGDIYLVRVEGYGDPVDPRSIGFDAAVEFAPNWDTLANPRLHWLPLRRTLGKLGLIPKVYALHRVISYGSLVERTLRKPRPAYPLFRAVTPSWDNSPRRPKGAIIFHGSTPESYEAWLRAVVQQTREYEEGDHRLVFVNAWNEWGEGNHLEPDLRWGRGYLEATFRALDARGDPGHPMPRGAAGRP